MIAQFTKQGRVYCSFVYCTVIFLGFLDVYLFLYSYVHTPMIWGVLFMIFSTEVFSSSFGFALLLGRVCFMQHVDLSRCLLFVPRPVGALSSFRSFKVWVSKFVLQRGLIILLQVKHSKIFTFSLVQMSHIHPNPMPPLSLQRTQVALCHDLGVLRARSARRRSQRGNGVWTKGTWAANWSM